MRLDQIPRNVIAGSRHHGRWSVRLCIPAIVHFDEPCVHEKRAILSAPSCRSAQLAKHRLSNNVGGVKPFLSVLVRALRRVRHFALVEDVPSPTKARSQSVFRSGTHAFKALESPLMKLN